MKSRAKCVGIDKAQIARPGIHVRRNDAKPSDVNRATAQHPHGFLVSAYRWRHRDMGDAKCVCDLVGRDTIRHEGRDPAVLRDFGVDRAEVYEPAKRIIAYVAEVDAVRHRSSVACGRLRAARESHPINSMIPPQHPQPPQTPQPATPQPRTPMVYVYERQQWEYRVIVQSAMTQDE
jgi:hypothetical protein